MLNDDVIKYLDVKEKLNNLCVAYFNTISDGKQYFSSWDIDKNTLIVQIVYWYNNYNNFKTSNIEYNSIYVTLENLLEFGKVIKK
jgi:hypothetical protein